MFAGEEIEKLEEEENDLSSTNQPLDEVSVVLGSVAKHPEGQMSEGRERVEEIWQAVEVAAGKRGLDLALDQNRFLVAHKTRQGWSATPCGDLKTALERACSLAKQAVKGWHPEVYVLDNAEHHCCKLQILQEAERVATIARSLA